MDSQMRFSFLCFELRFILIKFHSDHDSVSNHPFSSITACRRCHFYHMPCFMWDGSPRNIYYWSCESVDQIYLNHGWFGLVNVRNWIANAWALAAMGVDRPFERHRFFDMLAFAHWVRDDWDCIVNDFWQPSLYALGDWITL